MFKIGLDQVKLGGVRLGPITWSVVTLGNKMTHYDTLEIGKRFLIQKPTYQSRPILQIRRLSHTLPELLRTAGCISFLT